MERKIEASYFSVQDAEVLTGISRWTWRRWAYSGKVSSVKLGTRLLISAEEIQRFIAAHTRPRLSESE